MKSEATSPRYQARSKASVIAVNERTCVALLINYAEINSVTSTERKSTLTTL